MKTTSDDIRPYVDMVRPSALSGFLVLLLAGLTVLGLTFPRLLTMYGLGEYIQRMRDQPDDIWLRYQEASVALNSSELAANISVFVVWSLTGVIAYAVVSSLINAFKGLINFERDVAYFKTTRGSIIRDAFAHILIRLAAVSLLFGLYLLCLNVIIPAVVTAVQASFNAPITVMISYYVVAMVVTALTLHVVVVLIRLLLLRTRAFYGSYYSAK